MPIKQFPFRLASIRIFLDRAFKVDDEYLRAFGKEYTDKEWDAVGEVKHDYAVDVLLAYQDIVTRAALGELNSLVEYELKWIARSVLEKRESVPMSESSRISRGRARRLIESEYGISLNELPGFSEVDEVRKIVNAFKHDDGYSGEYVPFFLGFKEKKFKLDPDQAMKYLEAVREFLVALPGELSDLGDDIRVKT